MKQLRYTTQHTQYRQLNKHKFVSIIINNNKTRQQQTITVDDEVSSLICMYTHIRMLRTGKLPPSTHIVLTKPYNIKYQRNKNSNPT